MSKMTRVLLAILSGCLALQAQSPAKPPNFIILSADDLGYGDLSAYGHPTLHTPQLDRMAAEGQRWTNFYVAAPVCTPSRAAILTRRLPTRSGMTSKKSRVLFPDSHHGIPASEVTLAELLKSRGYRTAHIGKWHLGHLPDYLPTRHGFDYYYGIPYSNDMDPTPESTKLTRKQRFWDPRIEYFNIPLMRNTEVVERPADQRTITKRYTEEAIRFFRQQPSEPFFIYLAYNLPHVPLFRSKDFEGRSRRGLYGDVVEEIDWSAGQILDALNTAGLAQNTIVVFTSDNGPWLPYDDHGGSAGLLREGKGSTWEGGMRVPGIVWGPGRIAKGIVHEMGSSLDLLPTFAAMAGAKTDPKIPLDGYDLTPVLQGKGKSPRQEMFFYRDDELFALRVGDYKLHWATQPGYNQPQPDRHASPLLFHLGVDPGEQWNVAAEHPDIVAAIEKRAAAHRATVTRGKHQLADRGPR